MSTSAIPNSSAKCQTARHDEMPLGCTNERHAKCPACLRCYGCDAAEQRMRMERGY